MYRKGLLILSVLVLIGLFVIPVSWALTIFPIDRATILAGQRFDFKVEFDRVVNGKDVKITVNGKDFSQVFGREGRLIEKEKGVKPEASAVLVNNVEINTPGRYLVVAEDGAARSSVTWEVYRTVAGGGAKNVILMIGDGMSLGHRTAARILSKGIKEGKYQGALAMDSMPHMALVGTSGVDSVITDSANAASTYTTGHKSSVNALGVYADRTRDPFDDPKVETIVEYAKRTKQMAVGVVTDAEVQDATPAAMVAHTRRRAEKAAITQMFHDSGVDVLLGGGSAYFLPMSRPGSKRKDEKDFIAMYQKAGYALATTEAELRETASSPKTRKLLGLFHLENMDGVLDNKFLRKGTTDKFPHQPGLVEMTKAALSVLSRHPNGFVLMVEGAIIDKYTHPLDWERAVMDTIQFDQAIEVAKGFAGARNDTLVLVVADHTHGINIVGTIDDGKKGEEMRDKVGVYAEAGYPNYRDENGDGYPDRVDVSKRLALFVSNFPDHYETFRPKLDGTFLPAVKNDKGQYVANEAYKNVPGAQLRIGNLPRSASDGVHTADDVVLTAIGPGSQRVRGFMENTDVFRLMADALSLGN
jgi:alkaline phosphatase